MLYITELIQHTPKILNFVRMIKYDLRRLSLYELRQLYLLEDFVFNFILDIQKRFYIIILEINKKICFIQENWVWFYSRIETDYIATP